MVLLARSRPTGAVQLTEHSPVRRSLTPGAAPPGGFSAVLSQLAAVHTQELSDLTKEHNRERKHLRGEIELLRGCLQKMKEGSYNGDGKAPRSDGAPSHDGTEAGGKGVRQRVLSLEDIIPGEGFNINEVWKRKIDDNTWGEGIDQFWASYQKRKENSRLLHTQEEVAEKKYICETTICPNSNFRLTWDVCGLILITLDLLTLPFVLAFQPPETRFSDVMEWVNLLFWTGDMAQGFFLGYYERGQYIDDHRRILYHYLKTWFVIDALVVFPEWLMLMASSVLSGDGQHVNQLMKVLKGARAVRVLRLLKLQRIMNVLYDMIESEYTFIVLTLVRMLAFVLVLNHVMACLWFLIGRLAMERSLVNWIETGNVDGKDLWYMYTTSLHWSLTQFTPASMDISARNTVERIFSIVVLFFAMVTFSSIVASITGSMTSLRNMKADDMKQFWLLRRYLRQRSVTNDLANRIFKFLEHHLKIQTSQVQATNVRILSGLSEALRNEMNHQMLSPQIVGHPFFERLNASMNVVMHRICRYALNPQVYAEKEIVFNWGDEGKHMHFVKGGELEYKVMDGTKLVPPPQAKEWISEAVLWTPWRHQGDLVAISTVDLINLNPGNFVEVMRGHPRSWYYAKHYALSFVTFLNSMDRSQLTDVLRCEAFCEEAARDSESSQNTGDVEDLGSSRRTSTKSSMMAVPGVPSVIGAAERDLGIGDFFRRCRRSIGL
uniref:Cyclic nucleotide-binding domain-containing protein n=1 Tax=Alexandrium catenella TaxID=2925 RepID=A0A7S1QX19_ALECA